MSVFRSIVFIFFIFPRERRYTLSMHGAIEHLFQSMSGAFGCTISVIAATRLQLKGRYQSQIRSMHACNEEDVNSTFFIAQKKVYFFIAQVLYNHHDAMVKCDAIYTTLLSEPGIRTLFQKRPPYTRPWLSSSSNKRQAEAPPSL